MSLLVSPASKMSESPKPNDRSAQRPIAISFLLLLLPVLSACDVEHLRPREQRACPSVEKTDVRLACDKDNDCPPGSLCSAENDGAPPSMCREGELSCSCRPVYFPVTAADALITGFDASEFDLRADFLAGTYSFEPPSNANLVVCALLVADPQFSPDHQRITNSTKSLARSHIFRVAQGRSSARTTSEFRVSDLEGPAAQERQCASTLSPAPAGSTHYPIVTSLRVGCWAFNATRVIAATRLRNVQASALPDVKPPVFDCAALGEGDLDGRFCIPTPRPGRCINERCTDLTLQLDAGPSDASGALGDAGGFEPDAFLSPASAPVDAGVSSPVPACTRATELQPCQIGTTFSVGRCVASRCADQSLSDVENALAVNSCDPPGMQPGDQANLATDWLNCFTPAVQGYGSCYERACRLRCTNDTDCEAVRLLLGGTATTAHTCKKGKTSDGSSSYIGVCADMEGP